MNVEVTKPAVMPDSGQAIDARRRRLLEAAIKYVPWPELVALAAPYLLVKDKRHIEVLLRIYLMQRWFNLSSDEAEFEERELRDILNVPYMNVFSRVALLDKENIAQIKLGMILLKLAMLKQDLWERSRLIIDKALAKQKLGLEREAEDAETVLVVLPKKVTVKQKAKTRSRVFVPIRNWSFQARLLGGILAFQYAVMLAAPRDVLTRFPLVRDFVSAMEWVCGLTASAEKNTITYLGRAARHPELAQLFASLMIAMLPLYFYYWYRWLSYDRKRNYRHFVLSPYNRAVGVSNADFIKDGLSDEDQEKLGVSTQAAPGKQRSLVGIFIWSLLLFILPLGAVLAFFGFGGYETLYPGKGGVLWMKKALLNVGDGGVIGTFFAVLGIQAVVLTGSLVTAAFFCCWRDWFCFIREKLKKRTGD
ncbi:MAG: transposase [Candidatus Accumulibacter sp.]|jgi:hypothetical protein|nr:transposase [Accumulibacter sp.]